MVRVTLEITNYTSEKTYSILSVISLFIVMSTSPRGIFKLTQHLHPRLVFFLQILAGSGLPDRVCNRPSRHAEAACGGLALAA